MPSIWLKSVLCFFTPVLDVTVFTPLSSFFSLIASHNFCPCGTSPNKSNSIFFTGSSSVLIFFPERATAPILGPGTWKKSALWISSTNASLTPLLWSAALSCLKNSFINSSALRSELLVIFCSAVNNAFGKFSSLRIAANSASRATWNRATTLSRVSSIPTSRYVLPSIVHNPYPALSVGIGTSVINTAFTRATTREASPLGISHSPSRAFCCASAGISRTWKRSFLREVIKIVLSNGTSRSLNVSYMSSTLEIITRTFPSFDWKRIFLAVHASLMRTRNISERIWTSSPFSSHACSKVI